MIGIERIARYLDSRGTHVVPVTDDTIGIGLQGENIAYELFISCREPLVTVLSPRLQRIPMKRLDETIRLANLLNAQRLRWGTFWVDPEGQQLAFELAFPALGDDVDRLIDHAIGAAHAIDHYFPCFGQVVMAGRTAEEAIDLDTLPRSPRAEDGDDRPDPGGLDLAV